MSALGIFALVAVALLAFCALLQIPYGTEKPIVDAPADEGAHPHRDYLLSRGWHVDEDLESGRSDAPVVAAWRRPEDGLGPHTFADALLLQLTEDVERLGGYEAFASLCDLSEKGVER
ncbi:MAG: hypothetical protein M3R38_01415 [Actinomycetota bacterium]|nr:hypothetical protein [Actinomycetota bacterium]